MRILFITRKFPPSVGGMENFASDLYRSLDRNNQLSVRKVSWGGKNIFLPLVLPAIFIRAFLVLMTRKIDVIHIQDGLLSPMGWVLSAIFRKPYVVIIHGLDITYQSRLYQALIPKAVNKAGRVICISAAAASDVYKRQVDRSKLVVVPLGCEDDVSLPNKNAAKKILRTKAKLEVDNRRVIMNVGRLVQRKGIVWFIDNVIPRLIEKAPSILFVVVGSGADRQRALQAISNNGLEDTVKLLGRVDKDVMEAVYAVSEVFVMPNIKIEGDIAVSYTHLR